MNYDEVYEEMYKRLKPDWDKNCTYSELDFIDAVLHFRNMSIKSALESEDYIIKILAILDKRVGYRTLVKLAEDKDYIKYPEWVKQFFRLRFSASRIVP
jgi:hypothetical protein